jgi:hypothetical protein
MFTKKKTVQLRMFRFEPGSRIIRISQLQVEVSRVETGHGGDVAHDIDLFLQLSVRVGRVPMKRPEGFSVAPHLESGATDRCDHQAGVAVMILEIDVAVVSLQQRGPQKMCETTKRVSKNVDPVDAPVGFNDGGRRAAADVVDATVCVANRIQNRIANEGVADPAYVTEQHTA